MIQARIEFSSMAWEETAPGVRSKTLNRNGKRMRVVEFARSFEERDWCEKEHHGYEPEGTVELTFTDRVERLCAGDGFCIEGGRPQNHRLKVIGERARLFVVDP